MPKELYQRFIKDTAGTLKYVPVLDGLEVVPSAATITIVNASGGPLPTPVTGDSATIANNGALSFSVIAANTADEQLYKAVWSFTVSGTAHQHVTFYRVVKHIQDQLVTSEDVYFEKPFLKAIDFEDVTIEDFIDHQWNWIEKDLRDRGLFTFLMLRAEDVYFLHLFRVVWMIASNHRKEEGDEFDMIREEYKEFYADQRNRVRAAYDSDNDGLLTEDENRTRLNRFGLIR